MSTTVTRASDSPGPAGCPGFKRQLLFYYGVGNRPFLLRFLKITPFTFLILLFGLVSACRPAPPVVKIGLVGPFEGQYRSIGYDAIYSARLAVRETNLSGGIGRYRLSLVALDDGGDPELASEVAASLVVDEAVVAVVGHWLTETTAVSAPIYQNAGLPLIPAGNPPFGTADPQTLPTEFLADYAGVTPFEEVAGPYAAPAYDAFQLLVEAVEVIEADGRPVNRETMTTALQELRIEGLTGTVFIP